jgi:hypothetical protein
MRTPRPARFLAGFFDLKERYFFSPWQGNRSPSFLKAGALTKDRARTGHSQKIAPGLEALADG